MPGIYNPIAGLTYSGVEVYNASKAVAFADLDLSAIVGPRRALVLLKYTNNTGGACVVIFKPNGDADNYDGYSVNTATGVPNGQCALILALTGPDGILEWFASNAAGTVKLDLLVYI